MDRDDLLLAFVGISALALVAIAVSSRESNPRGRLVPVDRGYENLEEWEIIRDGRGRTVGVRAHRELKPRGVTLI